MWILQLRWKIIWWVAFVEQQQTGLKALQIKNATSGIRPFHMRILFIIKSVSFCFLVCPTTCLYKLLRFAFAIASFKVGVSQINLNMSKIMLIFIFNCWSLHLNYFRLAIASYICPSGRAGRSEDRSRAGLYVKLFLRYEFYSMCVVNRNLLIAMVLCIWWCYHHWNLTSRGRAPAERLELTGDKKLPLNLCDCSIQVRWCVLAALLACL